MKPTRQLPTSNPTVLIIVAAALALGIHQRALAAAGLPPEENCIASSTSLCLAGNQFKVTVTWRDFDNNTGDGQTVDGASDDSGLFWFFDQNNWEVLVKVLDGCGVNGNYWVFSAATTNVRYDLAVSRLENGARRHYINPLGQAAPATTDTAAFPCEITTERKIVPPAQGGMYIGQHEWTEGDIATLEATVGQHAALWSPYGVFEEALPPDAPSFDLNAAIMAWNEGRTVVVGAWDAVDLAESGIGIDRVLSGEFDDALSELAAAYRTFDRPMFFSGGREPNGIGLDYIGGFGPDGTETLWWALENQSGFDQFDPTDFPNPQLYESLHDPEVCDGSERLAALQRYYHDFFTRREGLDFLTFEGMGWGSLTGDFLYQNEVVARGFDDEASRMLALNCFDYRSFYPGDDYVDWVSLTFYMLDFLKEDFPDLEEDVFLPDDFWFDQLAGTLAEVSEVAPGKPVLLVELGLPDGRNQDSELAAGKVTAFFEEVLANHPQISAFALWSFADFFVDPESPFFFPFDCLIRPGTKQGDALRAIIDSNPGKFHSCVQFSDGTSNPACVE